MSAILSIDQGTTGTTVLAIDREGRVIGRAYAEIEQHYPEPGWVEHDAEEIWGSVERTLGEALSSADLKPENVSAVGITNQRETAPLAGEGWGGGGTERGREAFFETANNAGPI